MLLNECGKPFSPSLPGSHVRVWGHQGPLPGDLPQPFGVETPLPVHCSQPCVEPDPGAPTTLGLHPKRAVL